MPPAIIMMSGLIGLAFLQMLFFISRYIKCPPDKILVIFGKVSEKPDVKYLIHTSGAAFVWPVIQDYFLLDTAPYDIELRFEQKANNGEKIKIEMDFLCKISKDKDLAIKAAELFYKKERPYIEVFLLDSIKETIRKSEKENLLLITDLPNDEYPEGLEHKIIVSLKNIGFEIIRMKKFDIVPNSKPT